MCQWVSAFVLLEGLGLRLSASAAETRRMKPRLQRGARVPRHLRQQPKARRFPPGARPLPAHRSSAAVVGGVFSGVQPASPPGGRQRREPLSASQADDVPTAAGPKPRFKPTFQSYERHIDKAEKTFQSRLHAAARPRQNRLKLCFWRLRDVA